MQDGVACDDARHVHHGRGPAQDLLDRGRQERGIGGEPGALGGVLAEGEHAAGDGIAGRLVAGEDEQVAEVEDLLIGQRFAIDAPRP